MQHLYISIVSHGNDDDIMNNSNLLEINYLDNVTIIIRDNLSRQKLYNYCLGNHFQYSSSGEPLGFGANNNINFELATDLGMRDKDWFILFNPDIDISVEMIKKLFSSIGHYSSQLFAINLFFDNKFSKMEYSLREFPTFFSFFNVLKGKSFTQAYDKVDLANASVVDWAAASFLVFQAGLYKKLHGFDENYFMYYEDVDICYRANKYFNQNVVYLKHIKAVHQGAYQNRNIFSKHFRWYICSLLRFLFKTTFGNTK